MECPYYTVYVKYRLLAIEWEGMGDRELLLGHRARQVCSGADGREKKGSAEDKAASFKGGFAMQCWP